MRKVDITDKLSLDENPRLVIADHELEVNADAATVLKVMSRYSNQDEMQTTQSVVDMYELIFPEESRNEIEKMKLSFADFQTVIEAAMDLIMGNGEEEGNAPTRTTT